LKISNSGERQLLEMKRNSRNPTTLSCLQGIDELKMKRMIKQNVRLSLTLILFLLGCNTKTEVLNSQDIKPVLRGIWYYEGPDSTYWEVVISDKECWMYDDRFGVLRYDYELSNDGVLKQFYKVTHNSFKDLKISRFVNDTIWFTISQSNQKSTRIRINLDLDVDKIIVEDSIVVEKYVEGLRLRKKEWEEKHKPSK
jgi:hypothetical protein